jgi:flagellin-like hook-associated protein FlgL
LTLQYDASGTVSDTSPTISNSVTKTGETADTYTYNWTVPVGSQTATVKVRVKDSQRPNSYADSPATFEVIAAPIIAVSSPADGDVFVIDEPMTVNWTVRGLSVGNVNVEYWQDDNLNDSLDSGETLYSLGSDLNRGTSDTADEYSGKYTGSLTVTLPNTSAVSSNLKLRVRDPVGGYEGLASGHFRIRGGFEFRDETTDTQVFSSTTEWVANSSHTIKWYNKGNFTNVKIEYAISSDGVSWSSYNPIADSFTNNPDANNISSYSWTVPDPNLASYPTEPPEYYYVKLKLTDLSDTTVYEESPAFKITYYTVTWKVKDYDTYTLLDSLSVRSTYGGVTYWNVANDALTASSDSRYAGKTYPRRYPYGTYNTFWSKDGYIDRSDEGRLVDSDQEVTVYLESLVSAQMEYKVQAKFAYDEDTDKLIINSWLEKKGTLITGIDTDLGLGGNAYIKIYDGETLLTTLTDNSVDANGNYWFEVSNVTVATSSGGLGLVSGKTYFAKTGIWYRNREYQSGASFDISISKKLKEVSEAIQAVSTEIAAQTEEIKTKVEDSVEGIIQPKVEEIKGETAKILTAATETLPQTIDTAKEEMVSSVTSEVKPHVRSGILNRQTAVKQGDTITIAYRTESNLKPVIDVYDPNNVLRIAKGKMVEVGTTGVYEYDVTFLKGWGVGDFTIVCSEPTQGTIDALGITVYKHDIEDLAGDISTVLGTTVGLSNLSDIPDDLSAQVSLIETSIEKISSSITTKVTEATEAVANLETVYNQLINLSGQIKKLGATEEINLEKLYEVSKEKKEDIVYLKNKTEELKAAMEISQKMIDNVANKPVTQVWFEFR